ncbi:MAG: PAS domain S-box protein [Mucilaginibacter sp.]
MTKPQADETSKNNNYYKAIFDNSLSAIFFAIPDGTILDANQAASDIFGYTKEELKKLGRAGIIDINDPKTQAFLDMRSKNGTVKGELTGIRKNGERFACEASSVVFTDENGEVRTSVNLIDLSEQRASERQALIRQRLLNAVVENTNEGIAVTNKQGQFVIFNNAMVELLGVQPVNSTTYDWAKSFNIYDRDGKSLIATDRLPIVRALYGESIKDEVYLIKNPKKGRVYLSISASPIKDENGEIIGSLVIDRDITSEFLNQENLKKANDELTRVMASLLAGNERYRYVVKATNDAIWDMDLKTYDIQWGEGYQKIFGYQPENDNRDFKGWKNKIHPDDADRVVKSIENIITKRGSEIWEEEYRYYKSDGSIANVYDRGYIIYDKDRTPLRMVGALQDITERKNNEAERSRLIDDLIKQNKNLEQFTYIISHNLRSPVANIMGCAQMLKDEELTPAERESFVDGLAQSISKLDDVITDLHTILQLKNDISEKKEMVDLAEIFADVKNSLGNIIAQTGGEVESDFKITKINTIKSFIYSIFLNLISNGIKYQKLGTPPVINVNVCRSGDAILLVFRDNGLGIDLAAKGDDLFGLYKRFHSHVEGKGLGLFMVKSQIETMQGKIEVTSKLGEGTEFRIELPA